MADSAVTVSKGRAAPEPATTPVIELWDESEATLLATVPCVAMARTPVLTHEGRTFVASRPLPNGSWIYRRQLV